MDLYQCGEDSLCKWQVVPTPHEAWLVTQGFARIINTPGFAGGYLLACLGGRPCPPKHPLRCHFEPVRRLAWESVPRARRRGTPKPPSVRRPSKASLCEGGGAKRRRERRAGQSPDPYARSPGGKIFSNQRPLAATYLCRCAAKARFDNRLPAPGGCFQRGRAAALSLWSFQGDRIFKERGKSKSPFP